MKVQEALTARGPYLGGHPLYPSSATSVRVRDGKRLVTDGDLGLARSTWRVKVPSKELRKTGGQPRPYTDDRLL